MRYFIKILILYFGLVFTLNNAKAQNDDEIWYKISTEIALNFEKNPFEIRWRPDDHIFLPKKYLAKFDDKNNAARTDFMIGVNFWKFKLFNYSKFDEFGEMWTGIRFDYNFDLFNKKLLFNIQERYFWRLTKRADEHYYLIQFIRYAIFKSFQAGVLSYGKWNPDKDFDKGIWFIGPTVNFDFPHHFSLNLAMTRDIFFSSARYMAYLKVGYKIRWKRKVLTFTD